MKALGILAGPRKGYATDLAIDNSNIKNTI
jgi:hypothetical protein